MLINSTKSMVRCAFMFKEQSPCPRVLLSQTMPEGGSPRAVARGLSETTKPEGKGIVPIITQHM